MTIPDSVQYVAQLSKAHPQLWTLLVALSGALVGGSLTIAGSFGLEWWRAEVLKRATLRWLLDELRGNEQRLQDRNPYGYSLEDAAWAETSRRGLRENLSEQIGQQLNQIYTQVGIFNGAAERHRNSGPNQGAETLQAVGRMLRDKIGAVCSLFEQKLFRMGIK